MSRRCPECQHRDIVSTCALAVVLWFDRIVRIGEELAALSEGIADRAAVDVVLADLLSSEELPPSL